MPTLRVQNYVLPGYVRDGYCAPWNPNYVRSGYVRDGYINTTPRNINHALLSFDLKRLPLYPEFQIVFDQWKTESGGGVLFAGNPYAVRLYHSLSWSSISKEDRDNLENFYLNVARGSSERWVWWNPIHGNALAVRFADSKFPETPEIGYQQFSLEGLRLMVDLNLPGSLPGGLPNYNPSMGCALSIGSVLMQMPAPVRPETGYGIDTRSPLENTSLGSIFVQKVGTTVRRHWSISWTSLRYAHWIKIQAFFCSFVRGMKNPWTFYDVDGTAHVFRLAEPKITVKQIGFDRFSCNLAVTEDI